MIRFDGSWTLWLGIRAGIEFALPLLLAALAIPCDAATLNASQLRIQWSGPDGIGLAKAILVNAFSSATDQQLSATVCIDPFCTEPEPFGVPIVVTDPLTVRTTNFTLECTIAGLMCGSQEIIQISYTWAFADSDTGTLPVFFSLDGAGPPGYRFLLHARAQSNTFLGSATDLFEIITADANGVFGGFFPTDSFIYGAQNSGSIDLFITAHGVANPIVIRNMALVIGSADGAPVPEPITLPLAACAIVVFLLRRRRADLRSPDHAAKTENLQAALETLGQTVVMAVDNAA
jgi:hypothetical protein